MVCPGNGHFAGFRPTAHSIAYFRTVLSTVSPGLARLADPARLDALTETGLLEQLAVPALDRLAALARTVLGSAAATVTLVTDRDQRMPGGVGLEGGWAPDRHSSLEYSFCQYVVAEDAPFLVEDGAHDRRVADHALVREWGVASYAGQPLRTPEGQVLGSMCVVGFEPRTWTDQDLEVLAQLASAAEAEIALRLATHRSLRVSERFAAVLDGIADGYVAVDGEGRIVAWNRAAESLFGWSAAQAIGRDGVTLLVPDHLQAAARGALATARDLVPAGPAADGLRFPSEACDVTGRVFPVEVMLQVERTAQGTSLHAFVHDVTERRELELAKDRLLAAAGHELGNPLTVLRGYADLLADEPDLPPRLRTRVDALQRQARHAGALVRDLFDLAQLDAGEIVLRPEPVDLAVVVAGALEAAEPGIAARAQRLTAELAPAPLVADPLRLRQVVDNLVGNAAKYTPAGGRIEVRVRVDLAGDGTDVVVLEVADSGIGVPADELAHLGDRLFRASNARDSAIPGTGLGLAVTKAILEAHGGRFVAHPHAPGGLLVRVVLPVGG